MFTKRDRNFSNQERSEAKKLRETLNAEKVSRLISAILSDAQEFRRELRLRDLDVDPTIVIDENIDYPEYLYKKLESLQDRLKNHSIDTEIFKQVRDEFRNATTLLPLSQSVLGLFPSHTFELFAEPERIWFNNQLQKDINAMLHNYRTLLLDVLGITKVISQAGQQELIVESKDVESEIREIVQVLKRAVSGGPVSQVEIKEAFESYNVIAQRIQELIDSVQIESNLNVLKNSTIRKKIAEAKSKKNKLSIAATNFKNIGNALASDSLYNKFIHTPESKEKIITFYRSIQRNIHMYIKNMFILLSIISNMHKDFTSPTNRTGFVSFPALEIRNYFGEFQKRLKDVTTQTVDFELQILIPLRENKEARKLRKFIHISNEIIDDFFLFNKEIADLIDLFIKSVDRLSTAVSERCLRMYEGRQLTYPALIEQHKLVLSRFVDTLLNNPQNVSRDLNREVLTSMTTIYQALYDWINECRLKKRNSPQNIEAFGSTGKWNPSNQPKIIF